MSKKTSVLSSGRPSVRNNTAATLSSLADTTVTKRVNFELDTAEHLKLKIYAARQGKTVKELLTEYVAQLPNS